MMTDEQQARIEAHWAAVRAGLRKPQRHDFGAAENDVTHLIRMHKAIAMTCARGAAEHRLKARELGQTR